MTDVEKQAAYAAQRLAWTTPQLRDFMGRWPDDPEYQKGREK